MFKTDEMVMYGADLCKVEAIEAQSFFPGQPSRLYYILRPVSHADSTIYLPCDQGERKLRPVMTAGEISELRERTDGKTLEWIEDRQLRSRVYSQILQQGEPEQILLLIRCLKEKKEALLAAQKKFSVSDEKLLSAAEKMVDEEYAYVLDMNKDELPDFFEKRADLPNI